MDELIVLGTGNAMVTHCYNTCFILRAPQGDVLVDAGGGSGILAQLEKANVKPASLHELIITHEHCDHILGAVWMVRAVGAAMNSGKYEGNFTIHCHAGLVTAVKAMCGFTLQKKITRLFDDRILFDVVSDGSQSKIAGRTFTFFSIHSTKAEQYGFTVPLSDGSRLTCLGDEPYNPLCEGYAAKADWLLCEAFCLYADREKFKPYEKHHSTAADAAQLAQRLEIKHLVLWHTEDSDIPHRKEKYTAEAKEHFGGEIFVPDDLERIRLC